MEEDFLVKNMKNDARDYYFSIYKKIYNELNMEEFDSNFIDLYNNEIILEDEKEYPLEEVNKN